MHRVLSRALSAAVVGMPAAAFAAAGDSASLAPPPAALSPTEFRPLKVTRVEQLTADTRRVTLALPTESTELGGSTASCIVVRATVDGKEVVRPYTPTSPAHQRGSVDLVVKSYPKGKVSRCVYPLCACASRSALALTRAPPPPLPTPIPARIPPGTLGASVWVIRWN